MKKLQALLIITSALALAACGGGGSSAVPDTVILTPGQTFTMSAGDTVDFPSGTVVQSCDGSTVTVNGNHNTLNACAGTKFSVPTSATGPADNTATAP